jgi:hypothetical protein
LPKIFEKKEKMAEQKTEQPKKKGGLLPLVAAGVLLTVVSLGVGGCKQSTGPDMTPLVTGPTEQWIATWSGNITWGSYVTERESTASATGLGYQQGTESGIETRHENGVATSDTRPASRTVRGADITIPAGQVLNSDGTFSPRQQGQNPGPGPLEWESITPRDVDVYGELPIDSQIINISNPSAASAIRGVLGGINSQADGLETWFTDMAGKNIGDTFPGLGTRFTELAGYEQEIKNLAATVNKPGESNPLTGYAAAAEGKIGDILNRIFGADIPDSARRTFESYLAAYRAGKYLTDHDFGLNASGVLDHNNNNRDEGVLAAVAAANAAYIAALPNSVTANGTSVSKRGDNICVGTEYTTLFDSMVSQIVNVLGLSSLAGTDAAKVNDMARALVTQMGDNEEFDVLITDFQNPKANSGQGLSVALGFDYSGIISQSQTQSGVKLAYAGGGERRGVSHRARLGYS